MATVTDRLPENVPGKFYVDSNCIDCDQCRDAAPTIFARSDETCHSYVKRQPVTEQDLHLAQEAMSLCPNQAIGDDGA